MESGSQSVHLLAVLEYFTTGMESFYIDLVSSVHIHIVGDWTKKLAQLCEDDNSSKSLRLAVDGPFGLLHWMCVDTKPLCVLEQVYGTEDKRIYVGAQVYASVGV